MFRFRKILIGLIITCVLGILCCFAKPGASETVKYESPDIAAREYLSPTPGEICIVASTVYPDESEPTYIDFKQAADCGFNIVMQNSTTAFFEKALPLIDSVGMKLLMSSGELNAFSEERCRQYIEKFKNYPALGGWVVKDEPSYAQLEQYSQRYNYISEIDPDHMAYINLVGVASEYFGGPHFSTLKSYLEEVHSKCNPSPWSYDFYPITEINGKSDVNYNGFYKALQAYSDMSKESGTPFWAYCMSTGHRINNNKLPTPSEAVLRFEAFSALGYGAQGIVYWTYHQRSNVPSSNLYYDSALVNLNGEKTAAWYAAKKVNNEIKALNDVFYNSRLIDCRHTGDILYNDTKKMSGTFGPLKHIVSGNEGVMVSHLRTNGNDYLIIVSRDPFRSQTVRLNFEDVMVEELTVSPSGDNYSVRKKKINGYVKRSLQPGGYLVFTWN